MSEEQSLAEASLDFAGSLYSILAENDKSNLFISPLSILLAFSMTQLGARGNTANELAKALKLPLTEGTADSQEARKTLIDGATQLLSRIQQIGTRQVALMISNALFLQKDYQVLNEFKESLKNAFDADAKEVDFGNPAALEAACVEINKFVADHTNNMIPKLIAPNVLDPATRLVLINTVYFKGSWKYKFEEAYTDPNGRFHLNHRDIVYTPMMSRSMDIPYAHDNYYNVGLASLPYFLSGSAYDTIEMTIILPDDKEGLSLLEQQIRNVPGLLKNWYGQLDTPLPPKSRVDVRLPRFRMQHQLDLKRQLQAMGVNDLFSNADLSGMTDKAGLSVDAALHQAVVDVNEEGTEAAAATSVIVKESYVMPRPPHLHCDHPFIFVIRSRSQSFPDAPNLLGQETAGNTRKTPSITYFIGRYVRPPH